MQSRTDEQLIKDYLEGDQKSLEFLIERHIKSIYGFVYRYVGNLHDAEDITQDVFLRMWRNIKKFNNEKKFKTWLFTIAKNASLDFLKKKKPFLFTDLYADEENSKLENLPDPAPLPDEIFDKKNLAEHMEKIIMKLPENYRIILILYYNGHLNFREIAESLNEPLNTIKSRYRRALLALRKIIEEEK